MNTVAPHHASCLRLPRGEGRGEGAVPRPLQARRRGFTLTELLVVVAILAFLGALITPAVVRARAAARSAVIKKELDQLHQAMTVYGTKYVEFPPCWSPNIVIGGTLITSTNAAATYLQRLFPRSTNTAVSHPVNFGRQSAGLTFWNQSAVFRACREITPGVALTAWLHGYIPSNINRLAPVVSDQMNPFGFTSGTITNNYFMPRAKLFDFDYTRVSTGTADYGAYRPPRCPNSPYVYIDAASYGPAATPTPYPVVTSSGTTLYAAEKRDASTFFNPDTFQILCAGPDGIWGNDDDLSNFWKGTRRQFQESGR